MTKQTRELSNCFKRTAQEALKHCYGFCPSRLNDIEIFDGKGRTNFNFRVGAHEYHFESYITEHNTIAPDGISVWVGDDTVTKLK